MKNTLVNPDKAKARMSRPFKTIPIYQPQLSGLEKKYVDRCLDSSWISSRGEFVSRFEKEFATYVGAEYATTVSNGTVALHLALLALGIGPGDEVIVPTLTYIASVNAIEYVGATPVLVDSTNDTWNIDPNQIVRKITARTKAVMAVHLYGMPCDMDSLKGICEDHGLFLIEDAAEAFGSKYRNRHIGTIGDIAAFSFFGNKTITTGEGGMIVSNNEALISRAAYLKSQSVSPTREYWHAEVGFNYRMTNICAAIGVAQLEHADEIIAKKRALADWYKSDLRDSPLLFQEDKSEILNSYWMVSVLANDEIARDGIRMHLKQAGIETRPLFYPAHTMPVFKSEESFPVAESLSCRGLNLPSYPGLSREDVSHICSNIKEYFNP